MPKITKHRPPFYISTIGSVVLITLTEPKFEAIPGINALVEPKVKEALIEYLGSETVDDAAAEMGISRARVSRLREGLGIAGTYDGNSKTTQWRIKNHSI